MSRISIRLGLLDGIKLPFELPGEFFSATMVLLIVSWLFESSINEINISRECVYLGIFSLEMREETGALDGEEWNCGKQFSVDRVCRPSNIFQISAKIFPLASGVRSMRNFEIKARSTLKNLRLLQLSSRVEQDYFVWRNTQLNVVLNHFYSSIMLIDTSSTKIYFASLIITMLFFPITLHP